MQNSFYILPKTKAGKYSVVFMTFALVMVSIVIISGMNIDIPPDNNGFFSNMPLALLTYRKGDCF